MCFLKDVHFSQMTSGLLVWCFYRHDDDALDWVHFLTTFHWFQKSKQRYGNEFEETTMHNFLSKATG